ncbi:hypothetical protein ACQKP5_07065 [Pseudomonas vancouverensis]|uniref:hypothetical protein n=1 Tax=Pseudomonas vancouverensis TaxID=95300 RepID=UPI003CFE2E13
MTGLKKLLLAFTVLGASTAAFASDDNLASLTLGQTSNKVKKSNALNGHFSHSSVDSNTLWGARLSQQNTQGPYSVGYNKVSGTHNGIKLSQDSLSGRYDPFDGNGPQLSRGIAPGQTIALQQVSLEADDRFQRSNARMHLSANYAC